MLLLLAVPACAAPSSHETLGRATLYQEEGDEPADFEEDTGGDDVVAEDDSSGGDDVDLTFGAPDDEELMRDDAAADDESGEDQVAADDLTGGDELEETDPAIPEGDDGTGIDDSEPTVTPLSDEAATTDAKSESATPEKDEPHDQPPSFKDEIDRRIFNKQSNRKSTPLENQRYYNDDGSYWKPNPKTPGRWSKYDSEGNRLETDVPTREMPRETLTDAVPRVWQQWCRAEQEDGFRAICGGWKGISRR